MLELIKMGGKDAMVLVTIIVLAVLCTLGELLLGALGKGNISKLLRTAAHLMALCTVIGLIVKTAKMVIYG